MSSRARARSFNTVNPITFLFHTGAGSAVGASSSSFVGAHTGGGGASLLAWDAATGATGYNVYWSLVNGPPYANVVDMGNVLTAAATDFPGLGTGTRFFNIRSYDGSGLEGPWGTEITVVV